jgi:hypothetical protein
MPPNSSPPLEPEGGPTHTPSTRRKPDRALLEHQPEIGGEVPVRYRSEDPERAEIDRVYAWMVPAAVWLLVGVGLLVAAVIVLTAEPQIAPAAEESQVAPTVVDNPDASVIGEPVPTGSPPAKVATGRIGDKLTISDRSGKAQLEIAVTRLKFSTGDGVDQPGLGFYMGIYVEAHALADEQYFVIEALIDGRTYHGYVTLSSAEFAPSIDGFLWNRGDRAAGWLVLDVPARHGQLVLRDDNLDKVGVWTY